MVKIRLQRFGKNKSPFYRIVVTDATAPRDGRFLERLGEYDPIKQAQHINNELAKSWLEKGAVPTATVKNIFKKAGIN
jgi:small subunit ribosomal protein S16